MRRSYGSSSPADFWHGKTHKTLRVRAAARPFPTLKRSGQSDEITLLSSRKAAYAIHTPDQAGAFRHS